MSSLPIIDKCLQSVVVWSVSPGSNSADALVSWFRDNSPKVCTNSRNYAQV